jgi:hypothetical protein
MKDRRIILGVFALLLALAALNDNAFTQGQRGGGPNRAQASLDEPFRGVTTDGNVVTGLFPIRSSGVSTAPVRKAAAAFLAALDAKQRQAAAFPVDDLEWRKWSNIHRYTRQGVGFNEMNENQRELAFSMLRAGLSARGLKQTQDVMKLNGTLAEMTQKFDEYGEWLYWITVMGEPSATQPWGWQLDGHHLVINYLVVGDQVVMTPTFMGSEPIRADTGKFAGTVVLGEEEKKGVALMASLNAAQRHKAVLETSKPGNNALAQAFQDNLVLDYAGLPAAELTADQKQLLLDVVGVYVGYMEDGHARVKMEEVRQHLDKTYFAWIGGTQPDDVFYYRVQSPVVLIEFDHELPVGLPGPRVPGRLHIHSLIRTPNGNDYGKDLLRQHYERRHGLGTTRNAD